MNYAAHNYSSNPNRARKEALALQQKLGWNKETTLQEQSQFTETYPAWRLVIIQAAFPRSGYVHTGKNFVFDEKDKQKNVIYLLYDSAAQHFGLIASPKEIYKKYLGRNDIKLVPNEYHYARLALRRGRTDVRKLYHEVTDED